VNVSDKLEEELEEELEEGRKEGGVTVGKRESQQVKE
jgi:hypothetical protein